MLSVIRRSQVVGAIAIDSSTLTLLGKIEEVWLDGAHQVAYLSSRSGFVPLGQVADLDYHLLSTYGRLLVKPSSPLQPLYRLVIRSAAGEPLGWVEDFLFDWHTGEIVAYILAGQVVKKFGECAVLQPEDVAIISEKYLQLKGGAQNHLQPESIGIEGYLSEKSHEVQCLVKLFKARLSRLLTPSDRPEMLHAKITKVKDELAVSGQHNPHSLQEATAFLREHWESLQQYVNSSASRAKAALESAWRQITEQSSS